MALRFAHIYLPNESSGFLDDRRERFNIIEYYEIEEKSEIDEENQKSESEAKRIYREEL